MNRQEAELVTVEGIISMIGILLFYAVFIGFVIYKVFHSKNT